MISGVYLVALLTALGCVGVVDRRWRLVLWADWRRGLAVLAAGVVLFLAWDLVAVDRGFYRRGEARIMTGVQVASQIPLEEVFFILLLCYTTLALHRLLDRLVSRRSRRREEVHA